MSESTRIDALRIEGRFRKDFGDMDTLVQSMRTFDLIQPIAITPDLHLIAGERRVRAARTLGWTTIASRVVSNLIEAADLIKAERDENTCRKEMTVSEKVELAQAIERLGRPKAAERQAEAAEFGGVRRPLGRSGDIAGDAVGMSYVTYQRAKYVVDTANDEDETPEVRETAQKAVEAMDRGEMAVKAAQRAVNKARDVNEQTLSRKNPSPKKPETARPQPPRRDGRHRKHLQVIGALCDALIGLEMAADMTTELDDTVTAEEAARLSDSLSNPLRSFDRLKKNLDTRKATS